MQKIEDFNWWHSIRLPNGVITPGVKTISDMEVEINQTFSSIDLKNKTVLDIGASSGGFSIEAYRRGASRVVALDYVEDSIINGSAFSNDDHYYRKALLSNKGAIEFAARECNVPLEIVNFDVDASGMTLKQFGQFDVTLFLGLFYHLVDPIAALREACSVTKEVIVIETHIENILDDTPAMMFYPNEELNNDPTNWWGPNPAAVKELLKKFGFGQVNFNHKHRNRGIFHAWRTTEINKVSTTSSDSTEHIFHHPV